MQKIDGVKVNVFTRGDLIDKLWQTIQRCMIERSEVSRGHSTKLDKFSLGRTER